MGLSGCGRSFTHRRALLCMDSGYKLRRLAGSVDDSIEFEEEADATWCAARFPSLSAADACAAYLHGALSR